MLLCLQCALLLADTRRWRYVGASSGPTQDGGDPQMQKKVSDRSALFVPVSPCIDQLFYLYRPVFIRRHAREVVCTTNVRSTAGEPIIEHHIH